MLKSDAFFADQLFGACSRLQLVNLLDSRQ